MGDRASYVLVGECRIVGMFDGFARGALFPFDDGRIWRQQCRTRERQLRHNPRCRLYWVSGQFLLKVEGVPGLVYVERLR